MSKGRNAELLCADLVEHTAANVGEQIREQILRHLPYVPFDVVVQHETSANCRFVLAPPPCLPFAQLLRVACSWSRHDTRPRTAKRFRASRLTVRGMGAKSKFQAGRVGSDMAARSSPARLLEANTCVDLSDQGGSRETRTFRKLQSSGNTSQSFDGARAKMDRPRPADCTIPPPQL